MESHEKMHTSCSAPVKIFHAGGARVPGEDGECRDKPGGRAGPFLCSRVHFHWLSIWALQGTEVPWTLPEGYSE